jgi:hypothetical protein
MRGLIRNTMRRGVLPPSASPRKRLPERSFVTNVLGSVGSNARPHSGQRDSGSPRRSYEHDRHRIIDGLESSGSDIPHLGRDVEVLPIMEKA